MVELVVIVSVGYRVVAVDVYIRLVHAERPMVRFVFRADMQSTYL